MRPKAGDAVSGWTGIGYRLARLELRGRSEMTEYMFDPAWEQERARIGAGEELFDPATTHILESIGVDEGWKCLEIGAGGGTIASWLCERVGSSGHVVAIDLDIRFIEHLDHPNLEVR